MTFDGQSLQKFYDEITNFGEKPGGFGLKFVQKVCGQYELKFGKFAKVKKNVGVWVTDNVNKKSGAKPIYNNKPPGGKTKSGGGSSQQSTGNDSQQNTGPQNTGAGSSSSSGVQQPP
eukprot:CAMPEP_0201573368 /NCGR_PEP_ID=MMETSP0190_2-20130828/17195_1 /ASSEMBLY_ACC=CAM_ASM_000263 /TAXON_ID=37353 /ORGANISM="Rosalina sp." /LENGTH=116 /DNA_ID=CAMNT_0048000269 /DNA_START=247 /DNA_END=594 /DNA_ORIENTATION=+